MRNSGSFLAVEQSLGRAPAISIFTLGIMPYLASSIDAAAASSCPSSTSSTKKASRARQDQPARATAVSSRRPVVVRREPCRGLSRGGAEVVANPGSVTRRVLTMTTGTVIMWLGELIPTGHRQRFLADHLAGIVAAMPDATRFLAGGAAAASAASPSCSCSSRRRHRHRDCYSNELTAGSVQYHKSARSGRCTRARELPAAQDQRVDVIH
jgi:hypothetical protein